MDRLGFWGVRRWRCGTPGSEFQYPLMDRLGFWGFAIIATRKDGPCFSIR